MINTTKVLRAFQKKILTTSTNKDKSPAGFFNVKTPRTGAYFFLMFSVAGGIGVCAQFLKIERAGTPALFFLAPTSAPLFGDFFWPI